MLDLWVFGPVCCFYAAVWQRQARKAGEEKRRPTVPLCFKLRYKHTTSNKDMRRINHGSTFYSGSKQMTNVASPKRHITIGFCFLPIKKMILLSLFLSYTASILFVPGGSPLQKFLIWAGLRDSKDPSRAVLQKCAPFREKRVKRAPTGPICYCLFRHSINDKCDHWV